MDLAAQPNSTRVIMAVAPLAPKLEQGSVVALPPPTSIFEVHMSWDVHKELTRPLVSVVLFDRAGNVISSAHPSEREEE